MENETTIPRRRGVPHLVREVARACLFPEVSATSLTSWRALVLEFRGSTPATRAADDAANRAWVREQLKRARQVDELRAHLAVARDLARQHRRDLEFVLADLRRRGTTGAGSDRSILELAEHRITDVLHDEPTVDGAIAGLQVDAALARAGEAVPRG